MIYQRFFFCSEMFNLTYTKEYNLMVQRVKKKKTPLKLNLVIASFIRIHTLGRTLAPELFYLHI